MIREFASDININNPIVVEAKKCNMDKDIGFSAFEVEFEYKTFIETATNFNYAASKCPKCKSIGEQKPHSKYSRWLITREGDENRERRVEIARAISGTCRSTHAILPDVIIPYMQYSLMFILEVLWKYRKRNETGETVRRVCSSYKISISTLYEWKSRLLMHAGLDLGAIADENEIDARYWPKGGVIFSGMAKEFFLRHGFSFMQKARRATESARQPEGVARATSSPHTLGTYKSHEMPYSEMANTKTVGMEAKHGKSKGPISNGAVQVRRDSAIGAKDIPGRVGGGVLQEGGGAAARIAGRDGTRLRFKNDSEVGRVLQGGRAGGADKAAAKGQRRDARVGPGRGFEGVRHKRAVPEVTGDTS